MTPSKNFRKFTTSEGQLVLAGKSAEQNELVVAQSKSDEFVLHTKAPGSPFCNIKGEASKQDIKETAVFCAAYSRDWKENKKDIEVYIFKGKDLYKEADMKTGTFGVKRHKSMTIKKEEIKKLIEETK